MSHSRKKLDLTGQRSGKLIVLHPSENIKSRTAWVCRCDCGKETIVKTYHLRCGHTKTCGCQHSKSKENPLGLTYVDGSCVEVLANKAAQRNNISGVRGVHWMAEKQVWRAEEELFEPYLREFA